MSDISEDLYLTFSRTKEFNLKKKNQEHAMLKLHLPLEYRLLVALDIEHLLLLLLLSRFSRVQPHRRQPTRLPRPWDSPGKNTFSNAWKWKVKVKLLSRVRLLFVTPWTVAYHAPPSMGFSRQEYWSGVPLHLTPLPKIKSKFLHVGEALWLNESDGIFFFYYISFVPVCFCRWLRKFMI